MSHSESIKELAAALAEVQGSLQPAAFNAENPFLKNKYADLGAVIEASRDLLAANGLSVSQLVTGSGAEVGVTTTLMHKSGEWLETTVTLPMGEERGKSLAQVAGSIITYLRRYSLAAIIGIYADEDTDANPAPVAKPVAKPASKPVAKPAPASMTEAAKELGGVEVAPEPAEAAAEVQAAMDRTTSKGTRYGELNDSQLDWIINDPASKAGKEAKHAAQVVLNHRIANGIHK